MKRLTLVAVAALTIAIAVAAPAISENNARKPSTHRPPPPTCLLPSFEVFAAKVWAPKRWERGDPPTATIEAAHKRIGCAPTASHRHAMKETWRRDRAAFYGRRHRRLELIAVTPYDCGSAGRFAIPCYIVACESDFSWTAYNPSGAVGPYQLLGWGAPYPATTWAEKMANHRIASAVWAGGAGAGNWVCA